MLLSEQTQAEGATNVLLIEDNPGDVRLIEELLDESMDRLAAAAGNNGIGTLELRHADRLAEGLQHIDTEVIDVVLLDLGLPDSRGIDTLETVREQSQTVPIVVLTGLNDETAGVRAVQEGAQEYLVKDELAPMLLRRSLQHAIERKRFERTQAALHNASRNVMQAESKTEVSELVLDTAVDVLDISGIAVYLFEDSANVLQLAASTEDAQRLFDEIPTAGSVGTAVTWKTFITGETFTHKDVLEFDDAYREGTPLQSGLWIPLGDHGVIAMGSEEEGTFDHHTQQFVDHLAATAEAALDRVEREEDLREHRQEVSTTNSQLEELNRMNRLLREIQQALVQATTREAIEEAVCERLIRDERFAFAWIGETSDDAGFTPRTWAGADQGYLDAVSLSPDASETPPAVTAAVSGSVTSVPNVTNGLRDSSWRKAALTRGLQSVISIPLTYNELSYGVLTVFASEPDTFDTRSQDVLQELGEIIANAINSVETRHVLLTDTVVELELSIHDSESLLGRFAREADCQVDYGGVVPQSDGTTHIFFRASGATVDDICTVAENVPSVQRIDHISTVDSDDGAEMTQFEVVVTSPTVPSTLVECGAVTRSIQVTDSETRVVVEVTEAMGVRTFIDRLEERYSDVELVARRDRERIDRSPQAFGTALTDELTPRQLETLETAYHSGYFEWPRERTGEEVANSLDITQPTFNNHLRAAERKLCTLLFDGSPSAE